MFGGGGARECHHISLCECQKSACWSQFSSNTLRGPIIKLRWSGSVAGAFTLWAILLPPPHHLILGKKGLVTEFRTTEILLSPSPKVLGLPATMPWSICTHQYLSPGHVPGFYVTTWALNSGLHASAPGTLSTKSSPQPWNISLLEKFPI